MIGAKLHVKTILGLPCRAYHDSSIVDEDLNALFFVQDGLGTLSNGFDGGKVKLHDLHSSLCLFGDLITGSIGLFEISAQQDQSCTSSTQVLGSFLAYACVGT